MHAFAARLALRLKHSLRTWRALPGHGPCFECAQPPGRANARSCPPGPPPAAACNRDPCAQAGAAVQRGRGVPSGRGRHGLQPAAGRALLRPQARGRRGQPGHGDVVWQAGPPRAARQVGARARPRRVLTAKAEPGSARRQCARQGQQEQACASACGTGGTVAARTPGHTLHKRTSAPCAPRRPFLRVLLPVPLGKLAAASKQRRLCVSHRSGRGAPGMGGAQGVAGPAPVLHPLPKPQMGHASRTVWASDALQPPHRRVCALSVCALAVCALSVCAPGGPHTFVAVHTGAAWAVVQGRSWHRTVRPTCIQEP